MDDPSGSLCDRRSPSCEERGSCRSIGRARAPSERERRFTQGSCVISLCRPQIRSARVRPARFVVETPSPTYPPAHAKPASRSNPTELYQSRGTPSGPPHSCVVRAVPIAGHRFSITRRSSSKTSRFPIEWILYARGEMVGSTSSSDRDPIVRRALRVDDQVPSIGERLLSGPTDLVPERLRKRLGHHHQRVQRHHVATSVRQERGVSLGREHDDFGRHAAAPRPDSSHRYVFDFLSVRRPSPLCVPRHEPGRGASRAG